MFSNGYDDVLFPACGREKKSSKFIIVSSGRLSAEKDHETLTRAVGLSKYKNDIELRIAGAGPLADKLTKLARRTLCKNTFSIGFVEHEAMPEFLEQANLLVHSSLADIEGISVIEAMATGVVPVIADAPLSAASDFALCEHSVFEAQNPAHLAQQIDWWIEHPELREQWGMKYAREAKRKFSIAYSVQEFLRMEYEAYMQAHNF